MDEFEYDEKAFEKRLVKPEEARTLLAALRDQLAAATDFDADSLEQTVKGFCERSGIKIAQIIHALRVATTGSSSGFGMFETLAIIGQQKVVWRIDSALSRVATICADA